MTAAQFEQRAKRMLYRAVEDDEEREIWLKMLIGSFKMGVNSRALGNSETNKQKHKQ